MEKKCDHSVWRLPENCKYVPEAQRTLDALDDAGLRHVTDIEVLAP